MRTLIIGIVLLSLTGCAELMKPALHDDGYTQYAQFYHTVNACHQRGLISSENAVYGLDRAAIALNSHRYDKTRALAEIDRLASEITKDTVSMRVCERTDNEIAQVRQEIQIRQARQEAIARARAVEMDAANQQIQANGEAMRRSGEAAFQQQMNTLQSTSPASSEPDYNTYMINTPSGIVQRRCKELAGGNVYCF